MPKYDAQQIARELSDTALGKAYFGNALYVAQDFPGLATEERLVIRRFLDGSQGGRDRFALQDIAIKIATPSTNGA